MDARAWRIRSQVGIPLQLHENKHKALIVPPGPSRWHVTVTSGEQDHGRTRAFPSHVTKCNLMQHIQQTRRNLAVATRQPHSQRKWPLPKFRQFRFGMLETTQTPMALKQPTRFWFVCPKSTPGRTGQPLQPPPATQGANRRTALFLRVAHPLNARASRIQARLFSTRIGFVRSVLDPARLAHPMHKSAQFCTKMPSMPAKSPAPHQPRREPPNAPLAIRDPVLPSGFILELF